MESGIVVFIFINIFAAVFGAASLPQLKVDLRSISVSGISSGAVMATQFHVAFSSEVMGVGVIAGVPYLCAPAATCMTTPSLINVLALQTEVASAYFYLNIDSTTNMKNDKIWIFSGTKDSVVGHNAADKVRQFYNLYINSASQIKLVNTMAAEHGQITNNYGGPCGSLNSNYLNNCNYSAAYNLLSHIYGNLIEPNRNYVAAGLLTTFDQTPFTSVLSYMDTVGYVYVPTRCKDKTVACKLHIAFHGCQMGRQLINDDYVKHGGYNEVGELNNIIILYPQVVTSTLNPMGCWDWFAYTGIYYAFQSGPQMRAVHEMLRHISSQ